MFGFLSSVRRFFGFETKYFAGTNNLTKIWFSKDPDQFMDLVHMANLKDTCNRNPNSKITLVHGYLSEKGLKSMMGFCKHYNKYRDKKYHITPVHVDELIKDKQPGEKGYDPEDNRYNSLIRKELELWREGKGGNPAAASDMLRYTGKILAYSDCDVRIESNGARHRMGGPIAFRVRDSTRINNDIMMMAVDMWGRLHPDAANLLKKMRMDVLRTHDVLVKLKRDYDDNYRYGRETDKGKINIISHNDRWGEDRARKAQSISGDDMRRLLGSGGYGFQGEAFAANLGILRDYLSKESGEVTLPGLRFAIEEGVKKLKNKGISLDCCKDEREFEARKARLLEKLLSMRIRPLVSHTGPGMVFRVIGNEIEKNKKDLQATYGIKESNSFKFLGEDDNQNNIGLSWVEGEEGKVEEVNQAIARNIIGRFMLGWRGKSRKTRQLMPRAQALKMEGPQNTIQKKTTQQNSAIRY